MLVLFTLLWLTYYGRNYTSVTGVTPFKAQLLEVFCVNTYYYWIWLANGFQCHLFSFLFVDSWRYLWTFHIYIHTYIHYIIYSFIMNFISIARFMCVIYSYSFAFFWFFISFYVSSCIHTFMYIIDVYIWFFL